MTPKIIGYHELTEDEITIINKIKATEELVAAMVRSVRDQAKSEEARRQVAIARTSFENGFMHMVRAIAQTDTPWT